MVFKSKVDIWIAAVVVAAMILVAITMIPVMTISTTTALVSICGLLLGVGLPLWVLFGTYYVVEHGNLRIRSGPLRWSIALSDITSVEPSRAWWSSPALSLDRLKISYGNGKHILVSPLDKTKFLTAIGQ